MKYNDENLDSSMTETSSELKFFSSRNLLNTLILFGVICLLCWSFCRIKYDFSVLDDMNYEISLRDIVIIANGFDINNFILPVSIVITLLLNVVTKLNIISTIKDFKEDFKGACGCLTILLIVFTLISEILTSLLYVNSIKNENTQNASKPYIVNVDIKSINTHNKNGRRSGILVHHDSRDRIYFIFRDTQISINNYYKQEYLSELENAKNKKISLVVRDGGRGIPIIDDYKIFYDNDVYYELEVPTTVDEFYYGYNAYKMEEDSVMSNDTLDFDKETEQVAKNGTNRKTDRFGNYFEKRMPQISSGVTGRVTASCYVTEEGDIKNVKLTDGLTFSANNALIKAIGDMGGKWKGKTLDGAANVFIEIEYAYGRAHYLFVEVSISGTNRRYKDCYVLNCYGSFYTDRIIYTE